ncbi:MAG: hypothetical protein KGO02_06300 [Alphaproteobacteria bacterium]|nr:hypothetical protein [Alphaproteobacteria bacterium]
MPLTQCIRAEHSDFLHFIYDAAAGCRPVISGGTFCAKHLPRCSIGQKAQMKIEPTLARSVPDMGGEGVEMSRPSPLQ